MTCKPIVNIVEFLDQNFMYWRKKDKTSLSILVSSVMHFGQLDKGGLPYFLHVMHVALATGIDDQELFQAAILHDVIEDTFITIDDLKNLGFSKRVCDCVSLLTKDEFLTYDQNIERILSSLDACKVKFNDLTHNMMPSRLKSLSAENLSKLSQYFISYKRIKDKINLFKTLKE